MVSSHYVFIIDSIPSPSRFNTSLSVLVEGGMITALCVCPCACLLLYIL